MYSADYNKIWGRCKQNKRYWSVGYPLYDHCYVCDEGNTSVNMQKYYPSLHDTCSMQREPQKSDTDSASNNYFYI